MKIKEQGDAMINKSATNMLNTDQAAYYLGLARATLEAWRTRGGGPAFCKLGKAVRYRLTDLDAFILSRVKTNTAQDAE